MSCKVCTSVHRVEIEQALMRISPEYTIDDIAQEYDVSAEDVRKHAVLHAPLQCSSEELAGECAAAGKDSIAGRIKSREADILMEVAQEYLITLKNMGRRLNKYITNDDSDALMGRLITKPIVDMYIGMGAEIRQTSKALAEINQILNGPKEDSLSGLSALSAAIVASRATAQSQAQPQPPTTTDGGPGGADYK